LEPLPIISYRWVANSCDNRSIAKRRCNHQQPEVNYLPRFGPQLICLERSPLRGDHSREIDLLENLDIVHITLLVEGHHALSETSIPHVGCFLRTVRREGETKHAGDKRRAPQRAEGGSPEAGLSVPRRAYPSRCGSTSAEAGLSVPRRAHQSRDGTISPEAGGGTSGAGGRSGPWTQGRVRETSSSRARAPVCFFAMRFCVCHVCPCHFFC